MASAPTDPGRRGSAWLRRAGYSLALAVALGGWRALDSSARTHMFLINRSPSLPNWAYVVERGVLPARGQIGFFMPPRSKLVVAHFGKVPAPFGKIVYGVPGDRIERRGSRVFVVPGGTGIPLEVGLLKPRTVWGEPLAPGPVGIVPSGCYYMGSPHKDGFDSRYAAIGFICVRQIVGTARRAIL